MWKRIYCNGGIAHGLVNKSSLGGSCPLTLEPDGRIDNAYIDTIRILRNLTTQTILTSLSIPHCQVSLLYLSYFLVF